jgi:hypothetical protein
MDIRIPSHGEIYVADLGHLASESESELLKGLRART